MYINNVHYSSAVENSDRVSHSLMAVKTCWRGVGGMSDEKARS